MNIVEEGLDLPISISDVTNLQLQLDSLQAELTLRALDLDLDNHVLSTANPHSVTASQLNAETIGTAASAITAHELSVNHPIADISTKGMLSSSDKNKLDNVADNATFNESNAYLLDRANHLNSQAIDTITGLDTALANKQSTILILPIANGGTGLQNAPAINQLLIGNGSSYALKTLIAGNNVQFSNAPESLTLSFIKSGRELLTSARTYYVRTNGSNNNNGLTNTENGAF